MTRKHIKKIYSSDESNSSICAIIPAAGRGTRLQSPVPKILFRIQGKPIGGWKAVRNEHFKLQNPDSVTSITPEKKIAFKLLYSVFEDITVSL